MSEEFSIGRKTNKAILTTCIILALYTFKLVRPVLYSQNMVVLLFKNIFLKIANFKIRPLTMRAKWAEIKRGGGCGCFPAYSI